MGASAKDRALRLLGVRSRSREELRRRLKRAGFPEDEIAEALGDLERVGLVDDERFADEVVRWRLSRQGYGHRAALDTLRKAGVDRGVAERAVSAAGWEDDEARAEEVGRARLARLEGLAPDAAYRRLMGFLLRRGFDPEVVRTVCGRLLRE
ncbi:MAG TPA: regulatory protein RecX [Actinomycetota bacterium]